MTQPLLIAGGTVVTAGGRRQADVLVRDGRIAAVGRVREPAATVVVPTAASCCRAASTCTRTSSAPSRPTRRRRCCGGTTTILGFVDAEPGERAGRRGAAGDRRRAAASPLRRRPARRGLGARGVPRRRPRALADAGVTSVKLWLAYHELGIQADDRVVYRVCARRRARACWRPAHCENGLALRGIARGAAARAGHRPALASRLAARERWRPRPCTASCVLAAAGRRGDARRPRLRPRGAGRGRARRARAGRTSRPSAARTTSCPRRPRYAAPDALRFAMTPPLRAPADAAALWAALRRRRARRAGVRPQPPAPGATRRRRTTSRGCEYGIPGVGLRLALGADRRRRGRAADAGAARRGRLHGAGAALRPGRPQGRAGRRGRRRPRRVGPDGAWAADDAGVVDGLGLHAVRRARLLGRAARTCSLRGEPVVARRRARRRRAARRGSCPRAAAQRAPGTSTGRWPRRGRGVSAPRGPHDRRHRRRLGPRPRDVPGVRREGAHVVVGDVRRDPREGGEPTDALIAAARRLGALRAGRRRSRTADVDALVAAALELGGRLDVMVPNAVLAGRHSKGLLETTRGRLGRDAGRRPDAACSSAASAPCARCSAQEPIGEARGRLILISSQHGMVGTPGHVAYCAIKGGVVNLTRQLAVDFARRGILVNAIAPGKILTAPLDEPDTRRDPRRTRTPARRSRASASPRGRRQRGGLPGLRRSSSYISGTNLLVDGGWMAY